MKQRLSVISIGTAVLLIGLAAGLRHYAQGRDKPPAQEYTIARATRGEVVQTVTATGQLSPLVSVEVSSQISGIVKELYVDFNTNVRKGQVLAKIDPATYEQRLLQAQADLQAAEATYKLAALNARRLKDLRDQDLVTQQDYDQTESLLHTALAGLTTRQAAVDNARVDLARCTITSPIDGIVIYKQIEVGKTVVSSLSAPVLFTIARDLSRMRIVASISEVDVGLIHTGQLARFTIDAMPQRLFEGRIVQIRNPYTPSDKQNALQPQQGAPATFDTVIEVDNSSLLLRPGLTANVSIIANQREHALHIPTGALRLRLIDNLVTIDPTSTQSDETYGTVYRLPAGDRSASPEAVVIQLGLSDRGTIEVTGGLNDGDVVITGTSTAIRLPREPGFFF